VFRLAHDAYKLRPDGILEWKEAEINFANIYQIYKPSFFVVSSN
jgi:hypothetical protein